MGSHEPMGGEMERLPRPLDAVECRVLGALLEKEQATPEYYPLTLKALIAACNQKSNREPVMELSDDEVAGALDRLRQNVLVWRSEGTRSERWRHAVDRRWGLEPASKAIVTLLLLRGPQTAGELRGRSERLHHFDTPHDVENALESLASGAQPLVRELPREPGQKGTRWTHVVGEGVVGEVAAPDGAERWRGTAEAVQPAASERPAADVAPEAAAERVDTTPADERVEARLARLEARVEELERRLAEALGETP